MVAFGPYNHIRSNQHETGRWLAIQWTVFLLVTVSAGAAADANRPNVLLIFADDMNDFGFHSTLTGVKVPAVKAGQGNKLTVERIAKIKCSGYFLFEILEFLRLSFLCQTLDVWMVNASLGEASWSHALCGWQLTIVF